MSCPRQAALELLADIVEPPLLPYSGATLSTEAQVANIAAFRRSAEATVDVLQGLLLLLGYLAEEHFLAGWQLPELGELQRDVVPQASCAGHQRALYRSNGFSRSAVLVSRVGAAGLPHSQRDEATGQGRMLSDGIN